MKKLTAILGITVLGASFAGCGGSEEDAAKAMAAFGTLQSRVVRQAIRDMRAQAERQVEAVRERARLAATLREGSLLRSMRETTIDLGTCTAGGDMVSTFTYDCSWTFSGEQIACDGTTYTFQDGTGEFGMDIAVSGTTYTIGMDFNFDTDFKGGDVDEFINLDCKLGMDLTVDTATGEFAGEIDSCSGFSCSIDGDEVDCEDMQEIMAETQC